MTELADRLRVRYFGDEQHPYIAFELEIRRLLQSHYTLLDAGCGRAAPLLSKFRGHAERLIGVDVAGFDGPIEGLDLYARDLANTGLPSASVDVIMARSVMEHIADVRAVYAEFARVLRPNGRFVFLTANLWDYASLIAAAIPNRFHPWIVARAEGRRERDVFPTRYKSNTRSAIRREACRAGFRVERFEYIGQHPSYFMFNAGLFLIATLYEKLIASVRTLRCLRGWILCTLAKQ